MRHAWSGEDIVLYPRFTDPMCFFKEELDRGWAWVEAKAPDPDCVLLSSAARAANVRLHQAEGCERCFPLWPLIHQLYQATARQVGFYGYMYERHPFDAYLRVYSPKGRPFSLLDVPATLRDGVRRLNTSFATHERLHVEGPEGRR
jgi:thiol-disulfide isomerase/thioredoxin